MAFWQCQLEEMKIWFCYYLIINKKKWHTYISFFAGDDVHEQTDTRLVGNQIKEDKSFTQENKLGALDDKTKFNDGVSSSSNSFFST